MSKLLDLPCGAKRDRERLEEVIPPELQDEVARIIEDMCDEAWHAGEESGAD
jgi:hypothetical protein